MIGVERTDFVGIPVTDRARAVKFYGEILGLKRNRLSSDEWPEFHGVLPGSGRERPDPAPPPRAVP